MAQIDISIEELQTRYDQLRRAYIALQEANGELKANRNLLVETILTKEAREKKYTAIIENSPGALFLGKTDGTILEVNRAACDLLGYTEAEFKRGNRSDIFDVNDPEVNNLFSERKKNGKARGEINVTKKNGELIRMDISSFTFRDAFSGEERISTVMIDITDRKEIEEALRISNERFMYATKATFDAIWDWDIINDHLYWGEGYEKIFGYPILNKVDNHIHSFDNIHPDDRKAVFDAIDELIKGTAMNWTGEYRYKKINGEYAYVQDRAILIRDHSGAAVRMIGAMQDITKRKLAEDAIRRSEEKFNSLVNTIDGIVWEADATTFQFNYVSSHAEELLGYPRKQWIIEPGFWANHIHPDDRRWVVERCAEHTKQKKEYQFEYRMIANDGSLVWLANFVSVVIDNDQPIQLRGVMVDITARKKAEEQLVNERKLLRVLIDNLPDYIYVKDKDSRHIINNKANVELLGFDSEDKTVGKTIVELLGKEVGEEFNKDDWHVLRSGESIIDNEEPIQNGDGHRWLLTTKIPFKDENNDVIGLVGISRDITERRKAEGELKEKNMQLKELSKHLQNVREEERKHLAREVHDELGQLASVVKMDIDWLKIKFPAQDESYQNRIVHASSTADLLIKTIRKLASELRPGMLDELGLTASLEWKCKEFASTNGVACVFTSNFDDGGLGVQVKTELFRICQEALTNVMRHADATEVRVDICDRNGTIQLSITDNGKGFDTNQKTNNTLGLIGMRERSVSINGTLIINSEPGRGTIICAIIPKPKNGICEF